MNPNMPASMVQLGRQGPKAGPHRDQSQYDERCRRDAAEHRQWRVEPLQELAIGHACRHAGSREDRTVPAHKLAPADAFRSDRRVPRADAQPRATDDDSPCRRLAPDIRRTISPSTSVPFRVPRSRTLTRPSSSSVNSACRGAACSSSKTMEQPRSRPTQHSVLAPSKRCRKTRWPCGSICSISITASTAGLPGSAPSFAADSNPTPCSAKPAHQGLLRVVDSTTVPSKS